MFFYHTYHVLCAHTTPNVHAALLCMQMNGDPILSYRHACKMDDGMHDVRPYGPSTCMRMHREHGMWVVISQLTRGYHARMPHDAQIFSVRDSLDSLLGFPAA